MHLKPVRIADGEAELAGAADGNRRARHHDLCDAVGGPVVRRNARR